MADNRTLDDLKIREQNLEVEIEEMQHKQDSLLDELENLIGTIEDEQGNYRMEFAHKKDPLELIEHIRKTLQDAVDAA